MFQRVIFAASSLDKSSREYLIATSVRQSIRIFVEARGGVFEDWIETSYPLENRTMPTGAFSMNTGSLVVTVGLAAFINFAGYDKRSIFAAKTTADCGNTPLDLTWSAVNTKKLMVLHREAWSFSQLIPAKTRSFRPCPPIAIDTRNDSSLSSVLVINHDIDDDNARRVLEELASDARFEVEVMGLETALFRTITERSLCTSRARTHIHIGLHNSSSVFIRMIDSWASRCAVVQYLKEAEPHAAEGSYYANDGYNGIVARNVAAAVKAIRSLFDDRVLSNILRDGGTQTIEKLRLDWNDMAQEIVS